MKFEWDDDYRCGNSIIDFQHRLLFKFIQKLKVETKTGNYMEAAEEMVQFFKVYFIEHFGDEEKIMRETKYPKILVHTREHRRIRKEADEVLRLLQKSNFSSEKVYESFLLASKWLKRHFMEMDRELIEYLQNYYTEYNKRRKTAFTKNEQDDR